MAKEPRVPKPRPPKEAMDVAKEEVRFSAKHPGIAAADKSLGQTLANTTRSMVAAEKKYPGVTGKKGK